MNGGADVAEKKIPLSCDLFSVHARRVGNNTIYRQPVA